MDIQITDVLPQKPPFLMVDRILDVEPKKKATCIKLLAYNEPYFGGHFPDKPVMPGALQLEAINQVAEIALLSDPEFSNKLAYITGCNNVKFKHPAVPGDVLVITAELLDYESKIGTARGKIEVDGKVICEADILFYLQK